MNMASSASHEPVYVPMDAMQNQYVYIQPAQTSPVSVLSVQNPAPSYPDNYLAADEIAISGVKKRKSRTVVHEKWSKEEDKRLSDAVKKYGAKNWKKIASEVGGSRNDVQCLHRWRKVISPELVKGPWTPDEDMIIMKAVRDAGDVNNIKWCEVAAKLKGRIGKQCRERYLNYLDQNIKKSEWTDEEDKILFELQRVIGNRWCEIAKVLPGRSENNIKNRFNSKAKATYLLHHRTPMIPIQNLCTASPEDDPRQPRKKRKLMCPPLQQLLRYLNLSSQMLDSIIPPLAPFQISPNSSNTNCCSSSSSNLNNDLPIPDTVSIDDLTTITTTTNLSSSAPALLPLTSTTTTTTTTTNSSNNNSQLNDNIFSNNEENELNLLTKPTLTIVDQPFNNNTINTDNNNNTRLTRNNNNNIGVSTRSRTRNNNNSYYNNYYSGRYSNGRTTTRTTRNSAAAAAYAEKQKKQKEMKLQKQKLQQQQQQQQQNQLQQNDFQDQQQQQQQSQFPQFIYYFQPYIPSFNLNGYENSIYNNEYELSYQQPQSQQQQNPSQQNQQLQLHQLQSLDELDNENPNYIYMSNFSNNNNNNSINLNDSNNSLNSSTISNLMMLTDDSQNGNIEDEDVVRLLLNENGRYTDTLVPIPSFGDDSTTSTSGATSSVVSTTTTITSKSTTTSEDLSVLLNNSSNSLVNDNDKTNNDDTDKAINNL